MARVIFTGVFFFAAGAASFAASPDILATDVAAVSTTSASVDAYAVLDKIGDREHLPRLLTTEDANMSAFAPDDLQPVVGDFDHDGKRDLALAGVYNLPAKGGAYFLLVAGSIDDRLPVVLYAQDGRTPFYLHPAGATGEGDPGNQAFSVTTCVNCSSGTDFRWNEKANRFTRAPWTAGRITHVTVRPVMPDPNANVSEPDADAALQIVGKLKDVQAYVAKLKAAGGKLGTRVEPVPGATGQVRVMVFEKRAAGEKIYDAIDVELAGGRILKRKRT